MDSLILPSEVLRRGNFPVIWRSLNSLEFLVSSETTSTATSFPVIEAAILPANWKKLNG
jgi:hypothetical protein